MIKKHFLNEEGERGLYANKKNAFKHLLPKYFKDEREKQRKQDVEQWRKKINKEI